MTQKERDRLVVLKKAQKKLITQRQAGEELGVTERHVRRMLVKLKKAGDGVIVHGLRGRSSNRKLSPELRERAVRILSQEVYHGFDLRWPASTWQRDTSSTSAGKRCGS